MHVMYNYVMCINVHMHVYVLTMHICIHASMHNAVSRLVIIRIDGSDFVFDPLNLTFMAGNIDSAFSITINDDNLFEINETFDLNITFPSSLPLSVANRTTTIQILDNDRKH